jgi:hypothetical protein
MAMSSSSAILIPIPVGVNRTSTVHEAFGIRARSLHVEVNIEKSAAPVIRNMSGPESAVPVFLTV